MLAAPKSESLLPKSDQFDIEVGELESIRVFLEDKWRMVHRDHDRDPCTPDEKMCRYTALFVAELMTERFGGGWRVFGGSVWEPKYPDGGFFSNGKWNSHYWASDGNRIVDLTAEQFGGPRVIITQADDDRYKHNYTNKELVRDLKHVSERVRGWLDEWFEVAKDPERSREDEPSRTM